MSFQEARSSFLSHPSPFLGSDAVAICPINNEYPESNSQFERPPLKRPRNSEENQLNSMPFPRMLPPNAQANRATTNIFFKTRMCAKFRMGVCRNGENCNFAHGTEDLRQPPLNWQELIGGREEDRSSMNSCWDDDQRIIHRMKICKKFYNGEECPYGERCNFLHEDPKKFRDDSGRFRESSAISIGTTGSISGHDYEANRPVDAYKVNGRPAYWKTKLCSKFEATGQCLFAEKCHFAHGQAELQVTCGRTEGEAAGPGPVPVLGNEALLPGSASTAVALIKEAQEKKCLLTWKGPKKLNRIYGDWIDDMPLLVEQNLPSRVES